MAKLTEYRCPYCHCRIYCPKGKTLTECMKCGKELNPPVVMPKITPTACASAKTPKIGVILRQGELF